MDLNNIYSVFSMYGELSFIVISYFSSLIIIILLILEIPYLKSVYMFLLIFLEMYFIMMFTIFLNTNSKIDNEETFKIKTISSIIMNIEPEKNIDYMIVNTNNYNLKGKFVLLNKYRNTKEVKEIFRLINNSYSNNEISIAEKNFLCSKIYGLSNLEKTEQN